MVKKQTHSFIKIVLWIHVHIWTVYDEKFLTCAFKFNSSWMKTKMKVGLLDEDYFGLHEKSSLGGEWSSDHWCRICSDKCYWLVKYCL